MGSFDLASFLTITVVGGCLIRVVGVFDSTMALNSSLLCVTCLMFVGFLG